MDLLKRTLANELNNHTEWEFDGVNVASAALTKQALVIRFADGSFVSLSARVYRKLKTPPLKSVAP